MAILKISKQPLPISSCFSGFTGEGFILIELMVSLVFSLFFISIIMHYQTMILHAKTEALTRYALINSLISYIPKSDHVLICSDNPYIKDGKIVPQSKQLPKRICNVDYFCKKMDDEEYYEIKGIWTDYKNTEHSITLVSKS